jgi:hypothetical protein
MKKILLILIISIILSPAVSAQIWKTHRIEAGGGIGTTQFFGDIGGFSKGKNMLGLKDFSFRQTRFSLNVYAKYRILSNVTARVNLAFGSLYATDERGSNESRGYAAKTTFLEPSVIGEYYILRNAGDNSFLMLKGRSFAFQSLLTMLDCYAFTGIGGISYNVSPNSAFAESIKKTKGFSPLIPLGIGVNLNYSSSLSFGVETGARFVFSDNVEGYTSQYSKSNDMYFLLNINVIYKMPAKIVFNRK